MSTGLRVEALLFALTALGAAVGSASNVQSVSGVKTLAAQNPTHVYPVAARPLTPKAVARPPLNVRTRATLATGTIGGPAPASGARTAVIDGRAAHVKPP